MVRVYTDKDFIRIEHMNKKKVYPCIDEFPTFYLRIDEFPNI